MVETLVGTWRLEASENFEEFLQALGCNYILRKAGLVVTPDLIIGQKEDKWYVLVRSTFKNSDTYFKLNEEFDEVTIDGRKVKSLLYLNNDNHLVHEQNDRKTGQLQCTGRRAIVDGKLIEYLTCGDVKSTRTYFKVE